MASQLMNILLSMFSRFPWHYHCLIGTLHTRAVSVVAPYVQNLSHYPKHLIFNIDLYVAGEKY